MNDLNNDNLNNLSSLFEHYEAPFEAQEMAADWQQVADKIGVGSSAASGASAGPNGTSFFGSIGAKIGLVVFTIGAVIGINSIINTTDIKEEVTTNEPVLETLNSENSEQVIDEDERVKNTNSEIVVISNKNEYQDNTKVESKSEGEDHTGRFNEESNHEGSGKDIDHNNAIPDNEPVVKETEAILSSNVVCQNEALHLSIKNGKAGKLYWFKMKHEVNGVVETGAFERNKIVAPRISGAYSINIFEMTGESQKLIYEGEVVVKNKPQAKFDTENTSCGELTLIAKSKDATDYYWSVDTKSLSGRQVKLNFEKAGYKKVTLIAELDGCADTIINDVYAKQSVAQINALKVPNIFTPNNDGKNDTWEIVSKNPDLKNFKGQIEIRSNQTNKVVFESINGLASEWNGKFMNAGRDCESGEYTYIIKVDDPCSNGDQLIKTGLIKITR